MNSSETSSEDDIGYFETDPSEILEKEEAISEGVPQFFADWVLFLPTLIIAVLYFCAWLVLILLGMGGSGLARMFVVVMAVGVPILGALAFLRHQTIRVQINDDNIVCHQGWPKDMPMEIPLEFIKKVSVKRGLFGRLFNRGTLMVELTTGNRIAVADLASPYKAKKAIVAQLP